MEPYLAELDSAAHSSVDLDATLDDMEVQNSEMPVSAQAQNPIYLNLVLARLYSLHVAHLDQ